MIYGFGNVNDGNLPQAPLFLNSAGNLVGTTESGGTITNDCPFGCGTIFQLTPAGQGGLWTETFLFSFNGTNGNGPTGALAPGKGGTLYGATIGEVSNAGTVFGVMLK